MKKIISLLIILFLFTNLAHTQNINYNWSAHWDCNFLGGDFLGYHFLIEQYDSTINMKNINSINDISFSNVEITGNTLNGYIVLNSATGMDSMYAGSFSITLSVNKLKFDGTFNNSDGVFPAYKGQVYSFKGERHNDPSTLGKIQTPDGELVGNVTVKLLNYTDSLKAIPIDSVFISTNELGYGNGLIIFKNIYSSNYSFLPESPLYYFEPEYKDFLPYYDFMNHNVDNDLQFIAHPKAEIQIQVNSENVPFSSNIELTINVVDFDGNPTSGYFSGSIQEINGGLGSFPNGNTFEGTKSTASIIFQTPSAEEAGDWGNIKLKATLDGYPFDDNYATVSLYFDGEALENIWAEPKKPDHPSPKSKTAIIPASNYFPAKLFALAQDEEGIPVPNQEFTFKIEGTDRGEIQNENETESGNEVTVLTNQDGIASAFFFYEGGSGITEPVLQKIKVIEVSTKKSGFLEVKCGLGLTISSIGNQEFEGGVLSQNKKVGLMIGVESEFYPNIDLKAYAELSKEYWGDKELGVKFATSWVNSPDNNIINPEEEYKGYFEFNRITNPKPDGPKYILYALNQPYYYFGSSHNIPYITPKTKGPRVYLNKAALADVKKEDLIAVPLKVKNKYTGFMVDNVSDNIEAFLCAFGATTITQYYMLELAKKLWSVIQYDKVIELGTILDMFDFLCKWYKGNYTEAGLVIIKKAAGNYVDGKVKELKDGGNFTDSEASYITGGGFIKELTGVIDNAKKQAEFIKTELPKTENKNASIPNSKMQETNVSELFSSIEYSLPFTMGAFSHELLQNKKVVVVFNVNNAITKLNNQPPTEFDNENYVNLTDFMYSQSENTYACFFEKNATVDLEFTSFDSTLVVIFEGGEFTFFQYPAYNFEGANCTLEINPENSGVLHIDTNNDDNPDETVQSDKKVIWEENNGGGNTGGGTGGDGTYQVTQEWLNVLGSTMDDYLYDIETDEYGNVYVFGKMVNPSFMQNNISINWDSNLESPVFIAMYNPSGELKWINKFEAQHGSMSFTGELHKAKNNIYMVARSRDGDGVLYNGQLIASSDNGYLLKCEINTDGSLTNIYIFNIDGISDMNSSINEDGDLFITGYVDDDVKIGDKVYELNSDNKLVLIKIINNEIASDTIFDFNNAIKEVRALASDKNQNSYVCFDYNKDLIINRETFPATNEDKKIILKIDRNNKINWIKDFSGVENQSCKLVIDLENNLIISGTVDENSKFDNVSLPNLHDLDGYIFKISPAGENIDLNTFGSYSSDVIRDIVIDESNNYLFTYHINNGSYEFPEWKDVEIDDNVAFVKLGNNFNYLNHDNINSYGFYSEKISFAGDNRIIVAGKFRKDITFGEQMFYTVDDTRTNYDIFITSYKTELVTSSEYSAPENEDLIFYPNPTKNELNILSKNGIFPVSKISIFNVNGNLEKQLQTHSESFKYRINTSEIPTGVYFIKIENEKFTKIRKIIVTK